MKILALDTATEACSAALLIDDEVIERHELAPRRHAVLILPMIEAVLAEAGIGTRELDALAFGQGPGAFTGVRIATGVVQGIAFAADLPVAPVSTLAAIAREAMTDHGANQVVAAIDARMNEVYVGAYRVAEDGGVVLIGDEQVCAPDALDLDAQDDWVGAGTGWMVHAETLSRRLGIAAWWDEIYPRASEIAALGALAYQKGEVVVAEEALPVYLRDKVARNCRGSSGIE
jgi:tRNA threonylcarbamoyladenosine biosynthesis protein TsaB